MTTQAAIAREVAFHFQGKKDGLYQKKENDWVVRFTITSDDLNDSLKSAPLGTRYQIALVEIDENEEPLIRLPSKGTKITGTATISPNISSIIITEIEKPKRKTTLPEFVGMYCNDEKFQKFLEEKFRTEWDELYCGIGEKSDTAANVVRYWCEVNSRSEILPSTPAQKLWEEKFYNPYQEWLQR